MTAFNHYATEAFDVNAIDYILKPVHPARIRKAVERICQKREPVVRKEENIKILSLGGFDVFIGNMPVRWSRSKARELFAYLLQYSGQKRKKFKICEDLWPEFESQKALIHLQTAVHSLRKSLLAIGSDSFRIEYLEEGYEMQIKGAAWDVLEFRELYAQYMDSGDVTAARRAVDLYRGEYADGEDWPWIQLAAEELLNNYLQLLSRIAREECSRGCWREASETAEKYLRRYPYDGTMQRLYLEAIWHAEGIGSLAQRVQALRSLCREECAADIEPEAAKFCMEKGIRF